MPADGTPPLSSSKTGPGDPATRRASSPPQGGTSTTVLQHEKKRIHTKKAAKPYDKAARPSATATNGTESTASTKQKAASKTQATTTKKNKTATGKENRKGQPPGTRKHTQTKSKPKPNAPDAETIPSSDTLVTPSSPARFKVEEESHICITKHKDGAYTCSADVPCPSSPLPPSSPVPLPPSSPPPAVSTAELPLSAFALVRKSRRLLGLRASPVPLDAPPELRTNFRSRSSSVSSRGDEDAERDGEQSNDVKSRALNGGGHDGDRSNASLPEQTLRLPDDMIRDDGYAEREEWFDRKMAEYARPWDAPMDVHDHNDTALVSPYPLTIEGWTPNAPFFSSIAYSRSPCTTLSALFWECGAREHEKYRTACGECVERSEADARDCEGGGVLGRRPGCGHRNMGSDMDMDFEVVLDGAAEEMLEDAPWCINGARVRYDGSVVGVCRVCTVFGVSASGARGDNGNSDGGLLPEAD